MRLHQAIAAELYKSLISYTVPQMAIAAIAKTVAGDLELVGISTLHVYVLVECTQQQSPTVCEL